MISEFPLLVFTMLAGIAAGAYFLNAFDLLPVGATKDVNGDGVERAWVAPLVLLILVAAGGLASATHILHPERILNAMSNPISPITQESLWLGGLAVVMLVDLLLTAFRAQGTPRWLRIVGAVFAGGLMAVTGFAYASNFGVAGWRGAATFPLFFLGDIAMGAALLCVFDNALVTDKNFSAANGAIQAGTLCVLIGLAVQFASAGADAALAIAGAIVGPAVALVVQLLARSGKIIPRAAAWIMLAAVVAGMCIARYGFYSLFA